ncbi:MAG: hypothetical protein GWN58_58295 [Anaerolineae bacterium]|nr:hypothetical protein [Anaerolineae bacterium]
MGRLLFLVAMVGLAGELLLFLANPAHASLSALPEAWGLVSVLLKGNSG